jgi:CRP/FNR family transcriptional regulator, cyclic AMP receptor protein
MAGWFRRRSSRKQTQPAATSAQRSPEAETYARILGQVPLFLDLSKRDLQRLAVACQQRDYLAGAVLVQQDAPGAGLFVIVSGRVRVTQHQPGEPERELSTLGAGQVFGEMSLLDDMHRSATVTAVEQTRVLIVPVFDFRTALREDPDITIRLLAVLSRRLRRAESRQV